MPASISSSHMRRTLTSLTKKALPGTVSLMGLDQRSYVERVAAAFVVEFRSALGDEVPTDDPDTVGRQAALRAASGVTWDSLIGPFTNAAGAANALGGISRQAVNQRLTTKSLLGLRLAGQKRSSFVFPLWQFQPGLQERLTDVLTAAGYDRDLPTTGWTIASWLRSPDQRFDGLTPLDMMLAGAEDTVLRLAGDLAAGLASEIPAAQ
jgi:hypothetical protein